MLATAGLTRSTMSAKEAGARPGDCIDVSGFSCAYAVDCGNPSPTTPANAKPASADAYAKRRALARDELWLGSERSMRLTSRMRVTGVLAALHIGWTPLRRPFGRIKSW